MSEQTLIAFAKLSYGKLDFAKAEGCTTENGEGDTRHWRGGGRVKNCTLAKKGKRERNVRAVWCSGTPGTFRWHCSQSCVYSDKTTWRPRWKIPLETPWKWHFRDSKFQNVPWCLGPQKLVPLVQVPKPPTIHYQLAYLKTFDSPADVSIFDNLPLTLAFFTPTGVKWKVYLWSTCSYMFRVQLMHIPKSFTTKDLNINWSCSRNTHKSWLWKSKILRSSFIKTISHWNDAAFCRDEWLCLIEICEREGGNVE